MARKSSKLIVNYTDLARRTLKEIWNWNAKEYGTDRADKYTAFLRAEADKLATTHLKGRPVPTRPDYRYILIKRSEKGHGHIAIYTTTASTVELLAFYHTSQDWQGKAERGEV
jgi:plasmid stabilization system protein ParE